VGMGRVRAQDTGGMVGGGGNVAGLMACLQCGDLNRVLDGCSTRVGRAGATLAGARLCHASQELGQLTLCPWGESGCFPKSAACASRWERAELAAQRRAGRTRKRDK